GERFDALERRQQVINADVLDAWFDPSPKVQRALRQHLPWLLRTSPPTNAEGLVRTIAEVRGVDPSTVMPGAGSSDLIYLAMPRWVSPASRVLILDPTYGEYAHVLERVIGCHVDRFALHRREDYVVNPDRLKARLQRCYELVVLVNPNSPTGKYMPAESLQDVLAATPTGTRFWIDETYLEYTETGKSLERSAAASDNTIVCKSMSKAYALSGARAAYLCGPDHLIDELRPLYPPWAVSLPGQVAAVAALQDPDYYHCCYRRTRELRAELKRGLRDDCGLDVVDGVANFLLCHLPAHGPTAAHVAAACRRRDLFIRDVSSMGRALGPRVLRVAVKDSATNKRIVAILSEVLREGDSRFET
ncbi:MAG: pyridoxal phosphate-dependent aminotransferase, partial [Planctomycetota bacterium]